MLCWVLLSSHLDIHLPQQQSSRALSEEQHERPNSEEPSGQSVTVLHQNHCEHLTGVFFHFSWLAKCLPSKHRYQLSYTKPSHILECALGKMLLFQHPLQQSLLSTQHLHSSGTCWPLAGQVSLAFTTTVCSESLRTGMCQHTAEHQCHLP